TEDLDAYDSDCHDLSLTKAVLMSNLSSGDLEVLYDDTNSSAPNDLLVLSLVEQMTDHVAHLDKENQTNKMANESLTAELEGYKERVTIFEQRLNSQEKETVLKKLKDIIKSLMETEGVENVKKDIDEIETINIELEHSVAKLLYENENLRKEREHLKSIYRDQFDSIRKTRLRTIWMLMRCTLKRLENTDTLSGFVECARTQNPSEPLLKSACMFTKHVQELLVYVSQTCLNSPKPSEKLVAVTSINKDKRVRFAEPVTSSSKNPKQTNALKIKDSNKPLLTSTGVKPTTSASG
nr:hypothetical protein [Tanacetum cinerariifolium]